MIAKLGIKEGDRVAILDAPPGFLKSLGPLPGRSQVASDLRGGRDFVHHFALRRAKLEKRFPAMARAIFPEGMLWISWPKKSSGVSTDLSGGVVREVGLEHGLVDVKVCAVDDVWSGLKFVVRKKDRSTRGSEKRAVS